MERFTEKEIQEGLDKAYKEAGHNAYFGNGFKAGIEFANQGQNLPIFNFSGLFVLYREGAIDRIYWNSDEFQPYKSGCPTYSWEKANEYSKLLKCNFTDT